ncbi:MAG: insulinase family protein [Hymenobacter sp.]|nr:MAG: insulinase family protein [Hymenobacter sp.]
MIHFQEFTLANGLRCLVHEDFSTQLAVLNVLYDVGSRDESPAQTGFAHLFEHLMFSGSVNVPSYDEPLQKVGGENNAFTSSDLTNYYLSLPAANLETGFWLESDRMLDLAFSENGLDVQRKVVVEEFKQNYLNQPYGDVWLKLKPLAYQTHPYQWNTIGKEISHIEDAQMSDVRAFFHQHYAPQNAILVVAGAVPAAEVKRLAEKWFGPIAGGPRPPRQLPQEPAQTAARELTVAAPVPLSALYKAWHMPGRMAMPYYAVDLITEIMGNGYASRLYQRLVKEEQLFSSLSCYHTGSLDPGLLIVEGKVAEGKSIEDADKAVEREMQLLIAEGVTDEELEKARNKVESMIEFEDMSLLNRANNLAFYELLGDASLINGELGKYQAVTASYLKEVAGNILKPQNCSTLFYRKQVSIV